MPSADKSRQSTSYNLVKKLLDNPHLPAYIQQLETPVLGKLIAHVGLEDAQELIEFATPAQMHDLVESDTWKADKPGQQESFDPERFLEWLSVWQEMGPGTLNEKVQDLGRDVFSLLLVDYVVVVDIEEIGVTGSMDNFANYAVLPKEEENWPVIQSLLADLWQEDSHFLENILARCCTRRSIRVENTSAAISDETISPDVSASREDSRRGKGYVTPLNASVFLGDAKAKTLDDIMIEVAYDLNTRTYLNRNVEAAARHQQQGDEETTEADASQHQEFARLDALLRAEKVAEVVPPEKRLGGPGGGDRSLRIRQLLQQLGERNPVALQDRLNEVLYLSNILVSGTSVQGGSFTEEEAAKCVYATCNLGLTYCLEEEPFDDEDEMIAAFTESEPGLIKAFRIGYHLIGQLPLKAVVAIAREISSSRMQRRLRNHPWIQEQVARDFARSDVQSGIDDDKLEHMKNIIDSLGLVFDNNTCTRLKILCDPVPCFPKSLERNNPPQIRVDKRARYISKPEDLRSLLAFLERLDL